MVINSFLTELNNMENGLQLVVKSWNEAIAAIPKTIIYQRSMVRRYGFSRIKNHVIVSPIPIETEFEIPSFVDVSIPENKIYLLITQAEKDEQIKTEDSAGNIEYELRTTVFNIIEIKYIQPIQVEPYSLPVYVQPKIVVYMPQFQARIEIKE